ncbi:hypothetical protein QAD02_023933 [Eretmocerus hayati]|uniref:Uncharacterized protein n=1 Tax=Eretmocerus hayati TaxID=131215 RepID=A0ACC2PYV1_9HYME|nr:hypothetical protein QAD02_023933 [Eretmocerus hayati]
MSSTQLENLVQMVGADIYKASFLREAIPVREPPGDSMASLANHCLIGDSTVCNSIHETIVALWRNLNPIVFRRHNRNNWRRIATRFEQKPHCPHYLRAIDVNHVVIQCSQDAGSGCHNYQGSHSIVLLAVCDSEYKFTYYDVDSYGRRSDGGVYAGSSLAEKLLDGSMDMPPPEIVVGSEPPLAYCFFGDEAFPLQPRHMRPFLGKGCCFLEQRLFNYRMGQPRRFIENTIGALAKIIVANNQLVKDVEYKSNNHVSSLKYFEIRDFPNITIIEILDKLTVDCTIINIDFGTLPLARGHIRIRSIIENPPPLSRSKQYVNKIISGITNGREVVEFQSPEEQNVDNIMKEEYVEIIGFLNRKHIGIHFIKFEEEEILAK